MKNKISISVYLFVISLLFLTTYTSSRVVTVISQNREVPHKKCVVIDAGHGGVDGGTTSCTGILESDLNLEIALRLDDLMHLLGIQTKMIRTTDCSVYTEDGSIAHKKISDLKERVRIVNSTDNGILVSIHQNYFSQSKYSGAQVFHNDFQNSKEMATLLQKELIRCLNPNSNRMIKNATGIYLMEKVQCPALLVECGFLSNPQEEALLRDSAYQKKLCCVIASTCSQYLYPDTSLT